MESGDSSVMSKCGTQQ